MNGDSKRAVSGEPGGIPFQELIDKLIHLAFERCTEARERLLLTLATTGGSHPAAFYSNAWTLLGFYGCCRGRDGAEATAHFTLMLAGQETTE